jgi:hypothetical protein
MGSEDGGGLLNADVLTIDSVRYFSYNKRALSNIFLPSAGFKF